MAESITKEIEEEFEVKGLNGLYSKSVSRCSDLAHFFGCFCFFASAARCHMAICLSGIYFSQLHAV